MSFNGAGVFNRLYSWVNDAANGIKIRADRMDNEMNGMATGLTTCVTRDGQSPATANLPMGGFKHINVADATGAAEYATLGQIAQASYTYAVAGGTADALTADFTPDLVSLGDGLLLRVKAATANLTTTPTFSPDGFPVHTITKLGGQPLMAGDIFGVGHELLLQYSLTGTRWELLNPVSLLPFVFSGSGPALNSSGSITLPGGLILKFGFVVAPGTAGVLINFPVAFPTTLFTCWGCTQESGSQQLNVSTYPVNAGQMQLSTSQAGAFQVAWFALGR